MSNKMENKIKIKRSLLNDIIKTKKDGKFKRMIIDNLLNNQNNVLLNEERKLIFGYNGIVMAKVRDDLSEFIEKISLRKVEEINCIGFYYQKENEISTKIYYTYDNREIPWLSSMNKLLTCPFVKKIIFYPLKNYNENLKNNKYLIPQTKSSANCYNIEENTAEEFKKQLLKTLNNHSNLNEKNIVYKNLLAKILLNNKSIYNIMTICDIINVFFDNFKFKNIYTYNTKLFSESQKNFNCETFTITSEIFPQVISIIIDDDFDDLSTNRSYQLTEVSSYCQEEIKILSAILIDEQYFQTVINQQWNLINSLIHIFNSKKINITLINNLLSTCGFHSHNISSFDNCNNITIIKESSHQQNINPHIYQIQSDKLVDSKNCDNLLSSFRLDNLHNTESTNPITPNTLISETSKVPRKSLNYHTQEQVKINSDNKDSFRNTSNDNTQKKNISGGGEIFGDCFKDLSVYLDFIVDSLDNSAPLLINFDKIIRSYNNILKFMKTRDIYININKIKSPRNKKISKTAIVTFSDVFPSFHSYPLTSSVFQTLSMYNSNLSSFTDQQLLDILIYLNSIVFNSNSEDFSFSCLQNEITNELALRSKI